MVFYQVFYQLVILSNGLSGVSYWKRRSWRSEKNVIEATERGAQRAPQKRRNGKKGSGVGLDGDVHGAGAEGADEEPGEAAGAIDGEELEVVAGGEV